MINGVKQRNRLTYDSGHMSQPQDSPAHAKNVSGDKLNLEIIILLVTVLVVVINFPLHAATDVDSRKTAPNVAIDSNQISPAVQPSSIPPAPKAAENQSFDVIPDTVFFATDLGPKIQFATPVYDFGKIEGGKIVKCSFIFTNIGDRLLEITNVRTTCGCATTGVWSRQVAPGNTGSIPIQFNSGNFSGRVGKTITVRCNDTNQPQISLQIQGTVYRPIDLIPQSATFTNLFDPANAASVVRIINNQAEPLILSEPESSRREIAAELKTVQIGKEYQLIVTLKPPLGSGHVFGQIKMKTSAPKIPVLTVPVWAMAQRAVTVSPTQLILPAGLITNKLTQTILIRGYGTNSLVLSDVALNIKGVDVEVKELQPGRFFSLVLGFPKGFEIAKGEKVELTIKSNHPQFPIITVPVTQRLPPALAASPP